MKVLQILNLAVFAAAAVMTLVLAVVCLMLAVHLDQARAVGARLAPVLVTTAVFAGWAAVGGLAVWGVHRDTLWKWLAQAALVAVTVALVQFVRSLG